MFLASSNDQYAIDPRLFGAIGNGVADDSNALYQAALACANLTVNGKQAYVIMDPPVNYVCSGKLPLPGATHWRGNAMRVAGQAPLGGGPLFYSPTIVFTGQGANSGFQYAGVDLSGSTFETISISGIGKTNAGSAGFIMGNSSTMAGQGIQFHNVEVKNMDKAWIVTNIDDLDISGFWVNLVSNVMIISGGTCQSCRMEMGGGFHYGDGIIIADTAFLKIDGVDIFNSGANGFNRNLICGAGLGSAFAKLDNINFEQGRPGIFIDRNSTVDFDSGRMNHGDTVPSVTISNTLGVPSFFYAGPTAVLYSDTNGVYVKNYWQFGTKVAWISQPHNGLAYVQTNVAFGTTNIIGPPPGYDLQPAVSNHWCIIHPEDYLATGYGPGFDDTGAMQSCANNCAALNAVGRPCKIVCSPLVQYNLTSGIALTNRTFWEGNSGASSPGNPTFNFANINQKTGFYYTNLGSGNQINGTTFKNMKLQGPNSAAGSTAFWFADPSIQPGVNISLENVEVDQFDVAVRCTNANSFKIDGMNVNGVSNAVILAGAGSQSCSIHRASGAVGADAFVLNGGVQAKFDSCNVSGPGKGVYLFSFCRAIVDNCNLLIGTTPLYVDSTSHLIARGGKFSSSSVNPCVTLGASSDVSLDNSGNVCVDSNNIAVVNFANSTSNVISGQCLTVTNVAYGSTNVVCPNSINGLAFSSLFAFAATNLTLGATVTNLNFASTFGWTNYVDPTGNFVWSNTTTAAYIVADTNGNAWGSNSVGIWNRTNGDFNGSVNTSLNVKTQFGANSGGVTDTTLALQRAINYAVLTNTPGGEIYLPPGYYKITADLTNLTSSSGGPPIGGAHSTNSWTIRGDGHCSTVIDARSYTNVAAFNFGTQISNWKFKGFSILMPNAANQYPCDMTATPANLSLTNSAGGIPAGILIGSIPTNTLANSAYGFADEFEDIWVVGSGIGIEVRNTQAASARNCKFWNCVAGLGLYNADSFYANNCVSGVMGPGTALVLFQSQSTGDATFVDCNYDGTFMAFPGALGWSTNIFNTNQFTTFAKITTVGGEVESPNTNGAFAIGVNVNATVNMQNIFVQNCTNLNGAAASTNYPIVREDPGPYQIANVNFIGPNVFTISFAGMAQCNGTSNNYPCLYFASTPAGGGHQQASFDITGWPAAATATNAYWHGSGYIITNHFSGYPNAYATAPQPFSPFLIPSLKAAWDYTSTNVSSAGFPVTNVTDLSGNGNTLSYALSIPLCFYTNVLGRYGGNTFLKNTTGGATNGTIGTLLPPIYVFHAGTTPGLNQTIFDSQQGVSTGTNRIQFYAGTGVVNLVNNVSNSASGFTAYAITATCPNDPVQTITEACIQNGATSSTSNSYIRVGLSSITFGWLGTNVSESGLTWGLNEAGAQAGTFDDAINLVFSGTQLQAADETNIIQWLNDYRGLRILPHRSTNP